MRMHIRSDSRVHSRSDHSHQTIENHCSGVLGSALSNRCRDRSFAIQQIRPHEQADLKSLQFSGIARLSTNHDNNALHKKNPRKSELHHCRTTSRTTSIVKGVAIFFEGNKKVKLTRSLPSGIAIDQKQDKTESTLTSVIALSDCDSTTLDGSDFVNFLHYATQMRLEAHSKEGKAIACIQI